jgi:hypothetical protein
MRPACQVYIIGSSKSVIGFTAQRHAGAGLKSFRPMAVSDQTAGADDLDGAVTEHLDGVTPLARLVGEYRDHGSLDVIAVVLVDLVADFKL